MIGLAMIGGIILVAILAPWIATHDPTQIDFAKQFLAPGGAYYFGTDQNGYDIFSRVVWGAQYDLRTGLIVLAVATSLGSMLGLVAGYWSGKVEEAIMRFADAFLAFPGLILAIAVSAALNSRTLEVLVLAISIGWWPRYTRLVRAQTLTVKEMLYVEAAKASGSNSKNMLVRHIIPNIISPVIIQATLDLGGIILTAASLSFIGFGAPVGAPEWGRMVADGRNYLKSYWWIITFPGAAIFITVLGFNLLGDGLRDILDPRLRK